MWFLFLILVLILGFLITSKFFPNREKKLTLPDSFVVGSVISIPLIYFATTYLTKNLSISIFIFSFLVIIIVFFNFKKIKFAGLKKQSLVVFLFLITISFFLFNRSFSYDQKTSEFLIASNLYLDFGGHIPFIRSLSLGNNYPFEMPYFSNANVPYYFMFDFYTGVLERLGLRIDHSLNFLSAVSLASLIFYIYYFSSRIFKNSAVGFLSVLFFIFPSNLSFVTFLNQKGISLNLPSDIWRNSFYINNAPFDNSLIFNFFNFNTFLNQRHFILGISIVMFVFFNLFLAKRKIQDIRLIAFLGLMTGLLFLWHAIMLIGLLLLILGLFLLKKSKSLALVGIIAISILIIQIFIMHFSSGNLISLRLGFLAESFNFNFLKFWVLNLGVSLPLILIGFFLSERKNKMLLLIALLLFIVPNIITFSNRYDFDNHKFFNLWIIIMNFLSAFAIVRFFKKNFYFKILAILLTFIFIFSGMINNLVVKNDVYARITDYKNNKLMSYALNNIPANEVILTNGEIYDPMSLIGKKTFLGRVHWLFIYGRDPSQRINERNLVLNGTDLPKIKKILNENNIKYIVLYKNNFAKNQIPYKLFLYKEFKRIYEDSHGVIFKI